MSFCRACKKPIDWYTVAESGKKMPLDPEPSDLGTVKVDVAANRVSVVPRGSHKPLYVCHFATCPEAGKFRKPREAR